MLTNVNISNFAIIKNLTLDLESGMTAITGETGAGKSIVIDALDIALGERADPSLIRHGAERCEINLSFDLSTIAAARKWLQANAMDEANECIIRRVLAREGRSRSFINGRPVNLQQLRAFALHLVHVHSQHQHHALVRKDEQRRILDRFLKQKTILTTVATAYEAWQVHVKKLNALKSQSIDDAQRTLLEYQVNELNELAVLEGEWEKISQEHQQLAHSDELLSQLQFCVDELVEKDDCVQSALAKIQAALNKIQKLAPNAKNSLDIIDNMNIQVNEAIDEVRDLLAGIESDPGHLAKIERRLSKIHSAARKHHVDPEALPEYTTTLSERLASMSNYDAALAELEKAAEVEFQVFLEQARKLSAERSLAAKQLSKKITQSMHLLGMPEGLFQIAVTPCETTANIHGIDSVEFQVNTNPGQTLMNMAKVASGGELSRISLAIQVITAQRDDTPTLVFDEVDVGISGGTAEIVGKLLRELGQTAQILCITHLPQVAGQGQHHLRIGKRTENKQTVSELTMLNREERIAEIARMVGGVKITEQTLAHAEELLG